MNELLLLALALVEPPAANVERSDVRDGRPQPQAAAARVVYYDLRPVQVVQPPAVYYYYSWPAFRSGCAGGRCR